MKFTKNLIFLALFAVIAFSQCSDGEDGETRYPVGNLCLTASELAICSENLDDLDTKEEDNDSITNICEPQIEDGSQVYEFTVQFQSPFKPNLDCLTFEVGFEGTILEEGSDILNEWTYDPINNNIVFKISHDNIENYYNCELIQDDDQYTWICDMHATILFGGKEQLRYEFKIQITLGRNATADSQWDGENIVVDVIKNTVQGICCENELNIDTSLRFCSDFTCSSYLESPLTIKRGEEFVVEHYIVTPEFQHYYLEGQRIKLGPFFPNVVGQDGTNAGRFIWKLESNIASDDLVIESISLIHNKAPRRNLQELREDYKVKATDNMSIGSGSNVEDQQNVVYEKEELANDNTALSIGLITVGGLVLISMIGALAYYLKSKKNVSSPFNQTIKELQRV